MTSDEFAARYGEHTDAEARRAFRNMCRLLRLPIPPGRLDPDECRREIKRIMKAVLDLAWKRRAAKVRPTTRARSAA